MRDADTYRTARRAAWKLWPVEPWWKFNRPLNQYSIGSVQNQKVTMRSNQAWRARRSAYMPHDGGGRFTIDRANVVFRRANAS